MPSSAEAFSQSYIRRILNESAAIAPWGFGPHKPNVVGSNGEMEWTPLERPTGAVVLNDASGQPILALSMYAYARPTDTGRLLVWREQQSEHRARRWPRKGSEFVRAGHTRFLVLDTNELVPFSSESAAGAALANAAGVAANPTLAELRIPFDLPEGIHSLDIPDEFHGFDEAVTLGQSTVLPDGDPYLSLCAYAIDFAGGTVEVLPQDWWNSGGYDVMYQGVQRIARDPETGHLVGSGTRVSEFVLDESGRNRLPGPDK